MAITAIIGSFLDPYKVRVRHVYSSVYKILIFRYTELERYSLIVLDAKYPNKSICDALIDYVTLFSDALRYLGTGPLKTICFLKDNNQDNRN